MVGVLEGSLSEERRRDQLLEMQPSRGGFHLESDGGAGASGFLAIQSSLFRNMAAVKEATAFLAPVFDRGAETDSPLDLDYYFFC